MTRELTFKADSLFQSMYYDMNADYWCFLFADNIYASSSGFWRILNANKIWLVSLDHGQIFGLPKPLDLVEKISEQLTGKRLIEIKVDENTADLVLMLSDNFKIEIYISSCGYETYDFSIQNKRYIGLGSGDIAIIDN